MPHLPREAKVDVTKRHACHAKRRWMSPSARPAMQREGHCGKAPCLPRKVPRRHQRRTAPKRATRSSPVPQVPRLPRKTKVDVTKRHACHKGQPSAASATPATQNEGSRQVPRQPSETKDVAKCHACHLIRRWMAPSATPATQSTTASPATKARH